MYTEKFDKLVDNLYNKLYEDGQQQIPQQVDSEQLAQAVDQTQVQPGQAQAQQQQIQPTQEISPEQQDMSASQEESEQAETDTVDDSEIQEMAGQLAQMIRDYKSTAEDGGVEMSKFAAGMVVSAAIKDLKYKDRKDILKKIKAGGFSGDNTESTEQKIEPEQQEQQMAESFADRNNSERQEDRKKPKREKHKFKKGSPFGVNEAETNNKILQRTGNPSEDAQNINNVQLEPGQSLTIPASQNSQDQSLKQFKYTDKVEASQEAATGNGVMITNNISEIRMTKKQFEMCRLYEMRKNGITFTKSQLDKILSK